MACAFGSGCDKLEASLNEYLPRDLSRIDNHMNANSAGKLSAETTTWNEHDEQNEQGAQPDSETMPRSPRFESHALVEMRLSRWNPFSAVSAVLLDISWQGFKIEFVNAVKLRPGAELVMIIPLAPFHIQAPSSIKMRVVVKWIDARTARAGGVFTAQSEQHRHIIDKILLKLSPENT